MSTTVKFYLNRKIRRAYQAKKRYAVVHGGRGSGKSMQMAALVIQYALSHGNSTILCVRGTQIRMSSSSLQILKDVISMMGVDHLFIATEHTLQCLNGTNFLFYGAVNPSSFKSLQGIDLCWVDEATELSKEAWKLLVPTVRNEDSQFLVSFNPEYETDACYEMFIKNPLPNAHVEEVNYWENPYFPEVLRADMEIDKERDYQEYLHVWEGKLVQAVQGALWKKEDIKYLSHDQRTGLLNTEFEALERIVVAIDPAITSRINSDENGIIIAGKFKGLYLGKYKYLVIDDISMIAKPNIWAGVAIAAYDKYMCDRVIAEINQGGEMVETIIKNIRPEVPYTGVHASRGKITRAEPISALYEAEEVLHYRRFTKMEYEMVTYTGSIGDKSPNRMDGLVWALTSLSTKSKVSEPGGLVVAENDIIF